MPANPAECANSRGILNHPLKWETVDLRFKFQEQELLPAERLWLKEAMKPGFSARAAKAKLHGRLPPDFSPDRIDPRLYALDHITPLGLWHLDPYHPLLDAIHRTISEIKSRILDDHNLASLTAEEIAETTRLSPEEVGSALRMLGDMGHFYSSAVFLPNDREHIGSITFSDDNSFDGYLKYSGIEELLEDLYLRRGQALWNAVNFAESRTEVIANHASHTREGGSKSHEIFIVHGHDEATKESVARFIEKLGLVPVILHERPSMGRPIITKFCEEARNVSFAVVLMTPDDIGGKTGSDQLNQRARQNVVFELGFFIGMLAPSRVVALVKGNLEKPSDYEGVVYISLDREDWRTRLGSELRAAGITFDSNKAIT
ncbi:MAG TPA: nucleotide-binding protein [Rhizomicrobium sp.]|nr:nucleotide-binding protein [Rhizomicrobium sp.]